MIDNGIGRKEPKKVPRFKSINSVLPGYSVKKLSGHQLVTLFRMKLSEAAATSRLGPITYSGIVSKHNLICCSPSQGFSYLASSLLLMLLFRLSDIGASIVNVNGLWIENKTIQTKNSTAAATTKEIFRQVQCKCSSIANLYFTFL